MSSWQEPTGRERAIEALMDRDNEGDYFRVRKVMEEAVPAALQSRPNKITKAALVDQAFGLQEHVIQSAAQHACVFSSQSHTANDTTTTTTPTKPPQSIAAAFENKGYIWKHQAAIRKAKETNDCVEPPQKLMQILHAQFLTDDAPSGDTEEGCTTGDEHFQDLKSFVEEHCMMEPASSKKGSRTETDNLSHSQKQTPLAACENLVLNLTKLIDTEEDGEILSALWITILSMLSAEHPFTDNPKPKEASSSLHSSKQEDETTAEADHGEFPSTSSLQIGALLSLCRIPSDKESSSLHPELLKYFSEAATVYQERMEILEARRIVAQSKNEPDGIDQEPENENPIDRTGNAVAAGETTNDAETNAPPEGPSLHTSTNEDTIAVEPGELAAAGVHDDAHDRYAPSDSEPANRSHPSSDGSSSESSGEGSSSSSSESSDENNEPDNPRVNIPEVAAFVESERDISTNNDDDEAVLRGALGIRLGRDGPEAEAVRVILADSVVPIMDNLASFQSETPVSEDASSRLDNALLDDGDPLDDPIEHEEEEASLPRLPPAVAYPWQKSGAQNKQSDPDAVIEELLPPLDPSNLEEFTKVPMSFALVYLLKYAEVLVQQEPMVYEEPEKGFLTAPGGTGHDLFSIKNNSRLGVTDLSAENDPAVFQLIITCLLTIDHQRKTALENLKKAVEYEQAVSGKKDDNNTQNSSTAASADGSSLGQETDDPALALALNYVEDDTPLSIESLENKGMKRKAAAAAHDAESLRKTLQKRTEAWKAKSARCTKFLISTMKCLAAFLRSVTRKWLRKYEGGKRHLSFAKPISDYRQYLPARVLAGLRGIFDDIMTSRDHGLHDELYETSIVAWSECFPFLFPTANDMLILLNKLTQEGDTVAGENVSIDLTRRLIMLSHLSKRLRVIDALSILLPPPSTFIGDSEPLLEQANESHGLVAAKLHGEFLLNEENNDSSLVNAFMMRLLSFSRTSNEKLLLSLFHALCHRMNTVALLFDGLYAVTETEAEKTSHITAQKSKGGPSTSAVLSKTPSNSFVFDATKCSDSIAILTGFDSPGGNGPTILQRASKVWGTVLASKYFSPKTGIHRWAIRLDKCERGHIFIGVAASRANTRTYVGGDKHGWGMIGTQALWHDRRKIRGDYGASFRTGSTVIVTLDTNLGTLSLGVWNDSAATSDPMVQNLLSPKREGQSGGTIEDWGVAFEGLPLDAKLFPAVGLYQRDDRVTLLSVHDDRNANDGSIEAIGGKSFFPLLRKTLPGIHREAVLRTRSTNNMLSWDGVEYSARVLERCSSINSEKFDSDWQSVLLSVLSSLCLLPTSIPLLSQRAALSLLPHINRCIKSLNVSENRAILNLVQGDWVIRATSGDGDLEEYVVKFEHVDENGFTGTGIGTTGKSKNGIVSISGSVNGNTISFLEEWSDDGNNIAASKEDSSSCVILGSISLDGTKFEGKYMNLDFGTVGSVAGMSRTFGPDAKQNLASTQTVETLLCLAHSHLASIIADDVSKDGLLLLENKRFLLDADSSIPSKEKLSSLLRKPFLSSSCLRNSSEWIKDYLLDLCTLYASPMKRKLCGLDPDLLLKHAMAMIASDSSSLEDSRPRQDLNQMIASVDDKVIQVTRGRGSLSLINPELYGNSRRNVVAALIYHSRLEDDLSSIRDHGTSVTESLLQVWRVASNIMEDGVRRAISRVDGSRKEVLSQHCQLVNSMSDFLLDLHIDQVQSPGSILEDIRALYDIGDYRESIQFLRTKMMLATSSSLMHLIALQTTNDFLSSNSSMSSNGVESISLGLCKLFAQLSRNTTCLSRSRTIHQALPGPEGAHIVVRRTMRIKINNTFHIFLDHCNSNLARRRPSMSYDSVDSFVLSSLSIFMLCLDLGVTNSVARLLTLMKQIFAIHRLSLTDAGGIYRNNDDPAGIVKSLSCRDTSYAVTRCATATVHVCFYLLKQGLDVNKHDSTEFLANWFRSELDACIKTLEEHFGHKASSKVESCSNDEWDRFIKSGDGRKDERRTKERRRLRKGGPISLSELGTIYYLDFKNGFRSTHKKENKYADAPAHRHLSHWLHILCAVLRRDSVIRKALLSDTALTSLLLEALGVDHSRMEPSDAITNVKLKRRDKGILPARYRARIAYFLGYVLPKMNPNPEVAGCLFCLSASHLVVTGTDEESLVSQESVSLLRKLYDPSLGGGWRDCVDHMITDIMEGESLVRRLGLQSFLSGTITGVNLFSFVLLKPAVAHSGGQDSNLNSGGKHSLNSVHSIVPVGAESVVSGLMRSSAEGGIVSSIDEKTGICEVILTRRSQNVLDDKEIATLSTPSVSHGLTVRALRTPISDIVISQEVPLYLDGAAFPSTAFCRTLERSLKSLLSGIAPDSIAQKDTWTKEEPQVDLLKEESQAAPAKASAVGVGLSEDMDYEAKKIVKVDASMPQEKEAKSFAQNDEESDRALESVNIGIYGLSLDMMTLRSASVLLSNPIFLRRVFNDERCRAVLFKVLCLAWPEQDELTKNEQTVIATRHSDLSTIPLHEAKLSIHLAMLRNLAFREQVSNATPTEIWSQRAAEYSKALQDREKSQASVPQQRSIDANASEANPGGQSSRSLSQSTGGSEEDDDQDDANSIATQHLREAAIAQMGELGIPRSYAELALRRIGGANIEAAVHFCLENGSEIERLLAEEMHRQVGRSGRSRQREDGHLLQQLMEMGFPRRWCVEALAATGNNVDEALTWILSNNETLESLEDASDEDEADEDEEESHPSQGDEMGESESSDEGNTDPIKVQSENDIGDGREESIWTAKVAPLRVISGRATIDSRTLEVSGQSSGGFASVGVKGVLLKRGRWYYEVVLGTAGCIQLGFGDSSFSSHCNSDRGDGCGDSSSSFSFDGWRRLKWHAIATEWGCRWKEGDVIGCMVDMDKRIMSFTLNGQGESVGMGVAFSGFSFCGGLYPVVSFNRREKLRVILGGPQRFRYEPPPGYVGVADAILESVQERDSFFQNESILGFDEELALGQKCLVDLSDEEHGNELFQWSHRYYGSDASVHLGSARPKSLASRSNSQDYAGTLLNQITMKIQQAWQESALSSELTEGRMALAPMMKQGYEKVQQDVAFDVFSESISYSILLCRKLILHIMMSSDNIDVSVFARSKQDCLSDLVRLWKTLETVCSVQNWSGEAGAMAMAAEALGLGIQLQTRQSFERVGLLGDDAEVVLRPNFTQLLTSFSKSHHPEMDTSLLFPAAAEWGANPTTFLRHGLSLAVESSSDFRQVVLAALRRAIRLLSGIEESDSRISGLEDEGDATSTNNDEGIPSYSQPDARFVSYITGLLISSNLGHKDTIELDLSLFQTWSIGLLSASLPWRMVSAFTVASILNRSPDVFLRGLTPTLSRYFGRLKGTVARRMWAERAAIPVCSRYVQALIELLVSVRRCIVCSSNLPDDFEKLWEEDPNVSYSNDNTRSSESDWQLEEGWVSNEEIWTGSLVYDKVAWAKPAKSSIRPLTDGEGPPMLCEGCIVVRGPDWEKRSEPNDDDGFDLYQAEKLKREKKLKQNAEEAVNAESVPGRGDPDDALSPSPDRVASPGEAATESGDKTKKKIPHPKLAIGTVISIEPWKGSPGLARRVRWSLTGQEGVYRFGADGGRHDIVHVETNSRATRITKKHPFPETAEQCAARRGFGTKKAYSVILRFKRPITSSCQTAKGILEYPDFGAGIDANVSFQEDGRIVVEEGDLIFGSKDSGWEARFGQPSYIPGSQYLLQKEARDIDGDLRSPYESVFESLKGSTVFENCPLRNPEDGRPMTVTSTIFLKRGRKHPSGLRDEKVSPPPLSFDHESHASNLAVSRDGRSVTCVATEGRGSAFVQTGFSKGCHYWEVKIESCESGSIFIGCAEKPPIEANQKFNRWLGWGFVNFRATYSGGSEKVYGVHAHAGDIIGVLLDCDAGRISFFYDGMKYGEHILNDLGCAFENLSPFGFSVEGCGTGGQGQGATSGFPRGPAQGYARPKTLFPVVGLRNHGDRVTLCPGWISTYGVDGPTTLNNTMRVVDTLDSYLSPQCRFPDSLLKEAFLDFQKWYNGTDSKSKCRGSRDFSISLDTSIFGCVAASASLGLDIPLLPGDRIRLKRSSGRKLELAEEAVVLGQHQQRLFYKLVLQKNEGQSLNEGGDIPHFFEECDMVDGIEFVVEPTRQRHPLQKPDRFRWSYSCGLKVVYSGGAVIRSDVEINDSSHSLGTIPMDTIVPKEDILERRVNSCGVVRFKIRFDGKEGYISANIRGGHEEPIIQIEDKNVEVEASSSFSSPFDCARQWLSQEEIPKNQKRVASFDDLAIDDMNEFTALVSECKVEGKTELELDEILVKALSVLSDATSARDSLECNFKQVALAFSVVLNDQKELDGAQSDAVATDELSRIMSLTEGWGTLPPLKSVLARLAVLRTLNARAQFSLPWLPIRPFQEGSALLGGAHGFGPSVDRSTVSGIQWWTGHSVAEMIKSLKNLFFTSTKRGLLSSITGATTTPTALSHDEYELPREIRTVRINRMRAFRAMESNDTSIIRKYSVFSQLQNETKSWGGAALRRGYIAKGHGGQKRAFKVKFVGEGVNDYSGPYREVFAEATSEILRTNDNGCGLLGVLDASPNTSSGIGEDQGLYVFSSNGQNLSKLKYSLPAAVDGRELQMRKIFASLLLSRSESSREVEEGLVFTGRLVGTAFRHGILTDLPLPHETFWRCIAGEQSDSDSASQLFEIDVLASREGSDPILLWWQRRMLNFFVEGVSNVLPVEVLPLFSANELKHILCGSADVDVNVLMKIVEFEGYKGNESVIESFWKVLREASTADRKAFLQYVWARSRLPSRVADFDTPFKIVKDSANTGDRADLALPSASTCFFSLTLPEYSSAEILREKLLFAIHNVSTMETDFQTNSAEISEGYRVLSGNP